MTGDNTIQGVSRRAYLRATGLVGAASLAGCLSEDDESSGDGSSDSGSGNGGEQGSTLEVAHWWTGGDGGAAIQALLDGFREKYPDIELDDNPVAGGAGQNMRTVIRNRILQDDAPSTWQAWPGANLTPFVEADVLGDIEESVWDENGMKDAYLPGPKKAASPDGTFVTVPLNIHRLNNLFYNVSVVEEAGVDPSSIDSPSALLDAMETVETETDAVGMAHQTSSGWSTLQLWAQVLLGEAGADTYDAIMSGDVEANKDAIQNSLSVLADYQEYFNDDASSVDWEQANSKVIQGNAAFFHQGDWAAGMYRSDDLDFEFGSDWDHVPFPGTDGMYALNMDSFPFPANNPSPDATEKFLRYVGSAEAQELFNPKKGSIPPRTDVPADEFGPFLTRQMEDFEASEVQPPSLAHGLAVGPDVLSNFEDVFANFISDWDADAATQGVVDAFSN